MNQLIRATVEEDDSVKDVKDAVFASMIREAKSVVICFAIKITTSPPVIVSTRIWAAMKILTIERMKRC